MTAVRRVKRCIVCGGLLPRYKSKYCSHECEQTVRTAYNRQYEAKRRAAMTPEQLAEDRAAKAEYQHQWYLEQVRLYGPKKNTPYSQLTPEEHQRRLEYYRQYKKRKKAKSDDK